jgi:hypothetical protein
VTIPSWSTLVYVGWWIALSYVIAVCAIAFRLNRLHGERRANETPAGFGFLWRWFGMFPLRFIFSRRYRQIGDPTLSALVIVGRVLFLLYLPLFVYLAVTPPA